MNDQTPPLILASASPVRARMLRDAGIAFRVEPARLDERALEAPLADTDTDPATVAEILARAKAADISSRNRDAIVIGADQVLALEDRILHKPADREEARRRLLALSGRTHFLHSAICLIRDERPLWQDCVTCRIRFRKLDPGFVGRHVAAVGDTILESVGAYQVEKAGVQLIESIEGDLFSVQGLPLLQLLAELRRRDLIDG